MPFNLQIIRTSDFFRLNTKGEYDLEQTRRILTKIAKSCVDSGIDCALVDVREARSEMELNDLYHLALVFREMGFRKHHRLAILYCPRSAGRLKFFSMRPGERAKFFALCASEGGWNVQAFDDYGKAMEWFASSSPVK
jgi:hypothetical protein